MFAAGCFAFERACTVGIMLYASPQLGSLLSLGSEKLLGSIELLMELFRAEREHSARRSHIYI